MYHNFLTTQFVSVFSSDLKLETKSHLQSFSQCLNLKFPLNKTIRNFHFDFHKKYQYFRDFHSTQTIKLCILVKIVKMYMNSKDIVDVACFHWPIRKYVIF